MTQREPEERPEDGARTDPTDDTDVVLDVPMLNVEELDLEVDELRAHISARAEIAGFLNISVGVDAYVDKVKLNIKGVEAQLQLKVRLERILGSIDRALQAIDNNPQILDPGFRRSGETTDAQDAGDAGGPRGLAAGPGPDPEEQSGGPGRDGAEPEATPAARKKAEQLGLDLSAVDGTGANGRVLVKDVLRASDG